MSQFTDQMVMIWRTGKLFPTTVFASSGHISSRLSTLYQLPTMQRGV
ncbi:hypothetical protein ACLK17_06965 [Escherichia coli]